MTHSYWLLEFAQSMHLLKLHRLKVPGVWVLVLDSMMVILWVLGSGLMKVIELAVVADVVESNDKSL